MCHLSKKNAFPESRTNKIIWVFAGLNPGYRLYTLDAGYEGASYRYFSHLKEMFFKNQTCVAFIINFAAEVSLRLNFKIGLPR